MKNIWNDPRSLFNGNHFSSPEGEAQGGEEYFPIRVMWNICPYSMEVIPGTRNVKYQP